MWYLVIKTTIGTLDMSELGNFYRTKAKAEEMAAVAAKLEGIVSVEIKEGRK